jgi:hypothetical protein
LLVGVRIHPPQLDAIDAWSSLQPDSKLTRPEAIRRLTEIALATVRTSGTSAEKLAKAKKVAARRVPEKPSPARGEALLKKGLAEVTIKNDRRAK